MDDAPSLPRLRQLVKAGNFDAALQLVNSLHSTMPGNAEVLMLAATAHRNLNNVLAVAECMSQAVQLLPDIISNQYPHKALLNF